MEKEICFLEYSKSQNVFHNHTIEEALRKNLQTIIALYESESGVTDFIPIAVGTSEECTEFRKKLVEKYPKLGGGKGRKE